MSQRDADFAAAAVGALAIAFGALAIFVLTAVVVGTLASVAAMF